MPIYYVQYEASPKPESSDFGECGGAFINCWIKSESEVSAKQVAEKSIVDNHWKILAVEEECREVNEEYYSENEAGLEYYHQARIDGECYVYHRWPNEPLEEDDVH